MIQGVIENRNNTNHKLELLLPFFTLLAPYKVGIISVNTIGLAIIALSILFTNKYKVRWSEAYKFYALFLGYAIIKDVVRIIYNMASFDSQVNRLIEYVVIYFLVFICCTQSLDEDKLFKVWKIAGTIYIIGLLYHIIQLYVFGHAVTSITLIPGYVLRDSNYTGSMRPRSFFAEPSAFAWAMLPLEFIALRRKDIKWAIIATLSILASTSTVGIVLSVVLWFSSFIRNDMRLSSKIGMIFGGIIVILAFLNLPVFFGAYSKLIQVTEGGSTLGSRVIVGFQVLRLLDTSEWIFGSLYSDATRFVADHISLLQIGSVSARYFSVGRLFLNAFSQLVFNYGIIGVILFIEPLRRYISSASYPAKPMIIMIIPAIFGETMLLNSYYFVFVILMLLYTKLENVNN